MYFEVTEPGVALVFLLCQIRLCFNEIRFSLMHASS